MNYLALGDLIVERLQVKIPSIEYTATSIDLATVASSIKMTPSLYVYFVGDNLGANAGLGLSLAVNQTWAVVIAIKNLSEDASYKLLELGEIIHEVIVALQGWHPTDVRYGPLYRESSPSPLEADGGYTFFPLYFSSRFITTGS